MSRKNYDYSVLVAPSNVVPLSLFQRELVQMDTRIKLYPLIGDFYLAKNKLGEVNGYLPLKDVIAIPYELPTLSHEISHMVEIKNSKRWTLPDWGMSNIPKTPNGFFAALAREARVRAIQAKMCECVADDFISVYIKHSFWGDYKHLLPFGKFKIQSEVHEWITDLFTKTYHAWDKDRIKYEWSIRLDHIRDWMETNESPTP